MTFSSVTDVSEASSFSKLRAVNAAGHYPPYGPARSKLFICGSLHFFRVTQVLVEVSKAAKPLRAQLGWKKISRLEVGVSTVLPNHTGEPEI